MRSSVLPSSCGLSPASTLSWWLNTTWTSFVRSPGRSPCCTKGAYSRRATWTRCRTIPASSKSTLECECAGGQKPQPVLRRQPHLVGCRSFRVPRLAHVSDGPQRDGQDDAPQMHHGAAGDDLR